MKIRSILLACQSLGPYAHTHGDTYEEAAKNAQEVLELLIETYEEQGRSLPVPNLQVA